MTGSWRVWEEKAGRWILIGGTQYRDVACALASVARLRYYRPVCVAPAGVHPDVAYPEAAR